MSYNHKHSSQPLISSIGQAAGGSNKTFFKKIGIATRLLGKELHRKKLKWFDLRRADYRLGEKVFAVGVPLEHSQFARQLEEVDQRLMSLRQFEHKRPDTFGEKVKSWAKRIVRMAQTAATQRRRHRLLKQLGAAVLKSPGSDRSIAGELQSANLIAEEISSVDAAIRDLRGGTYIWGRRPLLASSLLLLLTMIGIVLFKVGGQHSPFVRQENAPSSLSEDQFKTLETQTAAFREQLRRQQAEMSRQEAEATQARIAAAERQYTEQRGRERAEVQKRAREQAQKDEQARREEAEREKQQVQIAAAEQARLELEEAEAKKSAREKAERDKAEAERVAAVERARKEKAAELEHVRLAEQKTTSQPTTDKQEREPNKGDAQNTSAAQVERGKEAAATMVGRLEKYPFPYDPQLLDKLYEGRLDEVAMDKLDLVAVLKAFQHAGVRIEETSDLRFGEKEQANIARYFSDGAVALQEKTLPVHPNYLATGAIIDATGGSGGEWAKTTCQNLMRLILQRAQGGGTSQPRDDWLLMKKLVVKVDDSDVPKPKQSPNDSERQAVDKQIKELAAKGAKVILADYGDPAARSNYHYVHLAFWYGEIPVLRRDLLAVSAAHPLADLGNIALTEVPQTLGEAKRKHVEALAAEETKIEVAPQLDNPRYLGWKGFAPGASATYYTDTGEVEVDTLTAIDSEKALVTIGDKSETISVKIRDDRTPAEKKPPVDEVVELNGKKFQCKRQPRSWRDEDSTVTYTTWRSDEVPGGLVRSLEDEAAPGGRHFRRDKTLQSYSGGKNGDWSGKPSGIPLFKTVFSFKGQSGIYPKGPLIQASDGNFYGTTSNGPTSADPSVPSGRGTVFKLTPDGTLSTLHVFNGKDGASPAGGLTKGKDGSFYGTTNEGGTRPWGKKQTVGRGTVFKITPNGQFTTLYAFAGMPDGWGPVGELVEANDGNFYGTTRQGGDKCAGSSYGCGTVFKITPRRELTILHRFSAVGEEGRFPEAGLAEGGDGKLYGTTRNGGNTAGGRFLGDGAIFAISPKGELTNLHSFLKEPQDGKNPLAGLVRGEADEFYGVSESDGQSSGAGVLFKVTSNGDYSVLHSFSLLSGGQKPRAGLLRTADGTFYGTTVEARGGFGSVFRFTPPDSLTTVYVFGREFTERRNFGFGQRQIDDKARLAEQELAAGRDNPEYTDGSYPNELIEAADGTLWGTTEKGGIWDLGTVFRVNPKAVSGGESGENDKKR